MTMRNKVLFLLCLSHLFGTPAPLMDRLLKGSPILSILPVERLISYDSIEIFKHGIPHMLLDKLDLNREVYHLKSTITSDEFKKLKSFLETHLQKIHTTPECSHVPQLSISLKPELKQLNKFLLESQKLSKDEKADKYKAIKPAVDEIISKVNEAIQEAVKENVYSSNEIEAAYAKLLKLGDALDLMSNELSREINFDSQMLQSDSRKGLYATLIELRNALARDEDPIPALVEVRSNLGMVYRLSFSDYERARTEAYYVLKLVRKKMGWDESHLDQAIEDVKRIMEEMYEIPINDWKDMIPVIPGAHIKGLCFDVSKNTKSKRLTRNEPRFSVELSYKQGKMHTFNLEDSLKLEWVKLCEIFETVYEKKPTEKSEELYRLLCALGEFNLIFESRQFLFFPWFNPVTYSRRCRSIHAQLHFFKSAVYSPMGKSFGLDMMHSVADVIEDSKKEMSHMSILNEAASRLHHLRLAYIGAEPGFFDFSDKETIHHGLSQDYIMGSLWIKTHFCLYRESQFYELSPVKIIITRDELPVLKKIENHEIALMLDTLEYRYDIVQLFFFQRIVKTGYESENIEIGDISASEIEEIETIGNSDVEDIETTDIAHVKKIKDIEQAETECGPDTSSASSTSSDGSR